MDDGRPGESRHAHPRQLGGKWVHRAESLPGATTQFGLRAGTFPASLAELERAIRARRAQGETVLPADLDRFEAGAAECSCWLLERPPEDTVETEALVDYAFPATSPDPVAPRGDVINRDQPR